MHDFLFLQIQQSCCGHMKQIFFWSTLYCDAISIIITSEPERFQWMWKKTKMASGITKLYPRTCLGLLNCKGMSKDNIWRTLPVPFPILSFPPLLFPSSPHRMCLRPSVCTSQVRTRDLGGYSTTGDLVRAVVENLRHRPVYWDVPSHPHWHCS